jgi:hypothetical protein
MRSRSKTLPDYQVGITPISLKGARKRVPFDFIGA